jgi:hypothetical protein
LKRSLPGKGRLAVALRLAGVLLLAGAGMRARADVVRLKNGQTWEGTVTADGQKVALRVPGGIVVYFDRGEVREIIPSTPKAEILARMRRTLPDDAASHYQLALWCRENDLRTEMCRELEEVLRHDPDHPAARRLLGYVKTPDGWARQTEAWRAKGYVLRDGQWVSAEESAALDAARRRARVRSLLGALASSRPEVRRAARRAIDALADARARPALEQALAAGNARIRLAAAAKLAALGSPDSIPLLVGRVLVDDDAAVRAECVRTALSLDRRAALQALSDPLRGTSLLRRRRAAVALGATGAMEVVPALVATLFVRTRNPYAGHPPLGIRAPYYETTEVPVRSGRSYTVTHVPIILHGAPLDLETDLDATLWRYPRYIPLREVRDALRLITGQDFGYDRTKWLAWWSRHRVGGVREPKEPSR